MLRRAIPEALKKGQPGTPEFRDCLAHRAGKPEGLTRVDGIVNMTSSDHNGFDDRTRVMVQIVDGKWKLLND